MKVLVIGASGFIGRNVAEALAGRYELITADRNLQHGGVRIDLQDPSSVADVLASVSPDAIVDCAGIVGNDDSAVLNPVLTRNLLEQVAGSNLSIRLVIIMGSAGEYGVVEPDDLPVDEDTPRRATSPYGMSKMAETDVALEFRRRGVPVVVARLFNPIGLGMPERMIIPRVLSQIDEFRAGKTDHIEVSRLDAGRDYIDVADIGAAIDLLLGSKAPKHPVYNIGSGVSTTNGELIDMMLTESHLESKPRLVETADTPEPLFAVQADSSRLRNEFGWEPKITIAASVRSIMHDK